MIKKFNEFNNNEEFNKLLLTNEENGHEHEVAEPVTRPHTIPERTPEKSPKPGGRPSPIRRDKPSHNPGPKASSPEKLATKFLSLITDNEEIKRILGKKY